ncbi:MAG: homogentisate 1,2-dioxygenase, partial [Gemmataceae bacterium]|nr:homogentisate 1,2-dioxygenase [Gemmataceae bacterium]
MPPYLRLGSLPPKRHIAHSHVPGHRGEGIYYEEVVTTAGFGRAYSICYHLRPPTRVRRFEHALVTPLEPAVPMPLRHFHLKTAALPRGGDPITGRVPLLFNDEVVLSRCRPTVGQSELYRNAAADEMIFVHRGSGTLLSMFGRLAFKPFDYLVVPRCTTYRLDFDTPSEADLLILEAASTISVPGKYLNPDGQIRLGAPYCERDLHGPQELVTIDREDDTSVLIKHGERWTRYIVAQHPFDVVGWDGMVYPFTFNADDFEPITGTVHQPPPIHQTFEGKGYVVCTFAPRLLDTHPQAIKV